MACQHCFLGLLGGTRSDKSKSSVSWYCPVQRAQVLFPCRVFLCRDGEVYLDIFGCPSVFQCVQIVESRGWAGGRRSR